MMANYFYIIFSDEPSGNQEPLQLVQYSGSDNNSPKTAALRSLREPYTDNLSLDSQRYAE